MKKHTIEFPSTTKKDVVVVGGGPAGVVAALAAGRNGANTLLIERESYLGGMMTGGLVVSMKGWRQDRDYVKTSPTSNWDSPLMVKGISLEVMKELQQASGTALDQGHFGDPSLREQIDPEIMTYVLDKMMAKYGVEVLFNTLAFDAVVEGDVLKGVAIVNKSGPQVILTDVVVDTSGDGDVAAAAGAPFEFGREGDSRVHGGSLMMDIGGVDLDKVMAYLESRPKKTEKERDELAAEYSRLSGGGGKFNTATKVNGEKYYFRMAGRERTLEEMKQDRREGKLLNLLFVEEWVQYLKSGAEVPRVYGAKAGVFPKAPGIQAGVVKHGKRRYDLVHTGIHETFFDQTNQEDISKALVCMRQIDRAYIQFLRERIPGFEDAYILHASPMVGTRESRRVMGEYVLTAEDCVTGNRFPDVIAKSGRAVNVHSLTGVWDEWIFNEPSRPFDIPYRCLVPLKIDSLLVAGRIISATDVGTSGIKGEPCCMSTGEAAGTAAALAVKLGVSPRKLDPKLLQKKLLEQGAFLFLEEEKEKEKAILSYPEAR